MKLKEWQRENRPFKDGVTLGKIPSSRNKQSDRRSTSVFELEHIDLTDLIEQVDINEHKYAITFTDDFPGAVSMYFL